jgi:regulator of replication initiation timing
MEGVTLEKINEGLNRLRMDIMELRERLDEEYELSDEAKKELAEAREVMKKDFVKHERIMEKFGRPS